MKTKSNLVFVVLLGLLLNSCGKLGISPDDSKDSDNKDPKISGSMKATLDGKPWEAKEISFGGFLSLIQINGSVDDFNVISLELDDSKLKINTTYELNTEASKQELISLVVTLNGAVYFGNSGTMKITKYTRGKTVEGEINAMLWDGINPEIKLENCKFSMTYK